MSTAGRRLSAAPVATKVNRMADPPEIRVSDQERERVAEEIRQHYAVGRLTEEEMTERVQSAYAARTQRDLDTLRHDLPRLPASRTVERAELAERRRALQRHLIQRSGSAFVPFFICLVIWVAAGATGSFWPIWAAIPAVIFLVANGWRLYGPAPELDRVERELTGTRKLSDRNGPAHSRARADRREARHERRGR